MTSSSRPSRFLGVDFSSAPSVKVPMWAAWAELHQETLTIQELVPLTTLEGFARVLGSPGPWVGGFDVPFSLPRKFIEDVGWPPDWDGLAMFLSRLSREDFVTAVRAYRGNEGQRELFRLCDSRARACSPMKVYFQPVGRMLHAALPLLFKAGVSILPCRPNEDSRIAFEAYPALAAEALVGSRSYKYSNAKKGTKAKDQTRMAIIHALQTDRVRDIFPFRVEAGPFIREMECPDGNALDSVLCSMQAAWAIHQPNYGMNSMADPFEGWILQAPH